MGIQRLQHTWRWALIADVIPFRSGERTSAAEREFVELYERDPYMNDNIPLDELGHHLRRTLTNRQKGCKKK
ncbi:hypothetical protein [Halobacillus kuroshimensis]|uniref:hypothetical protein n=1 Tax=Halobacillus kuroshimensis TaxID=302481 RepID=UPI00047F7545|nr:hypothetical protein [Halobacillus kuroshimensis]